MKEDPLAPPPPGSEALRLFREHFRLEREEPGEGLLERAARAFSRIPYENLTKLLKFADAGCAERARRLPREVLSDHVALGAGGTCFSLTAAFLHILRAMGFPAEPILADRRYGPNTHCALVVFLEGLPHLVDPGYLITRPIPLGEGLRGERRIATEFNEIILTPRQGGEKIDLHTIQNGARTYRLTFQASPADPGEFLRSWDESFGWDMMNYPVLTRVAGGRQIYLQDRRLLVRGREAAERRELGLEELAARIREDFGIDPRIAAKALEVFRRKGSPHGRPAAR